MDRPNNNRLEMSNKQHLLQKLLKKSLKMSARMNGGEGVLKLMNGRIMDSLPKWAARFEQAQSLDSQHNHHCGC
jgi:hypothetical protein